MEKRKKQPYLQQGSLKAHPFRVPEDYFESFPGRLKQRIDLMEHEPVQRLRPRWTGRFRVAMAAAVAGLALISYTVIRMAGPGSANLPGTSEELVLLEKTLLEQPWLAGSDYELAGYLDTGEEAPDEEETYIQQAMDYLAMNDVDLDLFFE
jgi:hypothetical protein